MLAFGVKFLEEPHRRGRFDEFFIRDSRQGFGRRPLPRVWAELLGEDRRVFNRPTDIAVDDAAAFARFGTRFALARGLPLVPCPQVGFPLAVELDFGRRQRFAVTAFDPLCLDFLYQFEVF